MICKRESTGCALAIACFAGSSGALLSISAWPGEMPVQLLQSLLGLCNSACYFFTPFQWAVGRGMWRLCCCCHLTASLNLVSPWYCKRIFMELPAQHICVNVHSIFGSSNFEQRLWLVPSPSCSTDRCAHRAQRHNLLPLAAGSQRVVLLAITINIGLNITDKTKTTAFTLQQHHRSTD